MLCSWEWANRSRILRTLSAPSESSTHPGASKSARATLPFPQAVLRHRLKNWPTNQSKAGSRFYASRKKQRIYFEYILIAGVNDSEEQAHLLAGHARRIGARINLIPYNTVQGLEWSRPSREKQERFLSIVRGHGVVATLRREKGHDIEAACGQLRLQTKRAEENALT